MLIPSIALCEEDKPLSIEFVPKKTNPAPGNGASFIEGPDMGSSDEPQKPAVLEPLDEPAAEEKKEPAPPAPAPAPPTPKPQPTKTFPPPLPAPTVTPAASSMRSETIRSERLVPSEPAAPMTSAPAPMPSGSEVIIEHQPKDGQYQPRQLTQTTLQAGERLRWKYPRDVDWRILEAYGATEVQLSKAFYQISGNFFHSFREGANRVQVPTLKEARDRRDRPDTLVVERLSLRLFVEVDPSAPNAPPPVGNCAVWQKSKLSLNDLASGEIDTVIEGKNIDHIELSAAIPGLIFILLPPSQIRVYAVKVDFEAEIFKILGREKGRADRSIEELARLSAYADTAERRSWCESRMAYEQKVSQTQSDKQRLYEMFLRNEIDAFAVVRSGQPLPHIQMAQAVYRHENLEISVGIYSDNTGKVIMPANAMMWINEAMPIPSSPFNFEIIDQSDPSFLSADTRFRSENEKLLAEERFKGSQAWVGRNVVIDIYHYLTFRPPQPQGAPSYLLDITMDITGGLKRLNKDQMVSARLGSMQITPNDFRIDISPQVLVGVNPMEKIVRDILMQPIGLRDWFAGRRFRIHDIFERVPIIPDELLNEIEAAADELGVKVYDLEKPKKASNSAYVFDPVKFTCAVSRTVRPGEMSLDISVENDTKEVARVTRAIFPKADVLDFAARSVASNRAYTRLQEFRPLSMAEWIELRTPKSLMNP